MMLSFVVFHIFLKRNKKIDIFCKFPFFCLCLLPPRSSPRPRPCTGRPSRCWRSPRCPRHCCGWRHRPGPLPLFPLSLINLPLGRVRHWNIKISAPAPAILPPAVRPCLSLIAWPNPPPCPADLIRPIPCWPTQNG